MNEDLNINNKDLIDKQKNKKLKIDEEDNKIIDKVKELSNRDQDEMLNLFLGSDQVVRAAELVVAAKSEELTLFKFDSIHRLSEKIIMDQMPDNIKFDLLKELTLKFLKDEIMTEVHEGLYNNSLADFIMEQIFEIQGSEDTLFESFFEEFENYFSKSILEKLKTKAISRGEIILVEKISELLSKEITPQEHDEIIKNGDDILGFIDEKEEEEIF